MDPPGVWHGPGCGNPNRLRRRDRPRHRLSARRQCLPDQARRSPQTRGNDAGRQSFLAHAQYRPQTIPGAIQARRSGESARLDQSRIRRSVAAFGAWSAKRNRCPEKQNDRMKKITVLLVDDHPVVRSGLRALLAAAPDLRVVGEAADGRTAVREVLRLEPDVVLM